MPAIIFIRAAPNGASGPGGAWESSRRLRNPPAWQPRCPDTNQNCVSGGPRRATRVERLEIPDSVVTGNCLISVNSSEQLIGLCGNTTSRKQAEGWEWEGEGKREKEWVHPLEHTLISSTAWNALKPLSQISQELVAMLKLRTRSDDKWAEVEVKTHLWNYRWEVCRYGCFALWLFFFLFRKLVHITVAPATKVLTSLTSGLPGERLT